MNTIDKYGNLGVLAKFGPGHFILKLWSFTL
jgi:hypothetical protein